MFRIIGRRLLEVVLFVLFVTFFSFLFLRLAPGDPALTILNVDELNVSQEQVEALREDMGFNDPLLVQYGKWLLDFVQLDFGNSYITSQPVSEMLLTGLPATLELTIGSLIVMLLVAIPLGSLSALYKGSWIDHISRYFSIIGAAVPSFWLGLILIDVFAVKLSWFPTMGRDSLLSLVLPAVTLGLAIAGVYVRLLRSSLLESLGQEFVRAARARGISERRIFFSHAFRYSLPPVITVFGVSLGSLIGGVVVVEVLFAYPGVGKLVVDSIRQRDYPLIQGYIVLMAAIVFVVNTLVDLSYRYVNPELRLKERKLS
ncbi:nickel ABC transporter permease subunit NikB [Terribacillus saccharophilus]|jgi:peptide/nickel transport system permease protein|uniref:Nickel import system permease protein NikB n=1 Tax=Terribacillus saccharophilus TaxID=361277 RepID=A0A268HAA5_9BACI|nr:MULTISPECIES: nickel ABC transporter permease [Terribacillus]PAD34657.1 nickel ABC transporter permease subunit NikB [Terribacillus saccharophilus]PAD95405.1 nickel ABC transporter permease subunit NikB [Terribacillus saccharophilus]PAD98983.1 nickel ABC transporter permease subunit NikB [Terribacillus saccharophilus]PAE06801.1 nickel ABC transporter permease subunit NikB [Terribacillus saccharophilus]